MNELNNHLHSTWKSFIRKDRKECETQTVPLAFMEEHQGLWVYDKEHFYEHAKSHNATTRHELEMVGNPTHLPGVAYNKLWEKSSESDFYLLSIQLYRVESGGVWFFPIEQLVWTPHKNLSRRKVTPALTTYGFRHWMGCKVVKIRAWGESKTAHGWSHDPRCNVSDKTITQRINLGWAAEDAISIPSKQKPE